MVCFCEYKKKHGWGTIHQNCQVLTAKFTFFDATSEKFFFGVARYLVNLALTTLLWTSPSYENIIRFRDNDFRHCLTLFPKFFSSFPHGTCSLSVLRTYEVLDEMYHPFALQFQGARLPKIILYETLDNKITGLSPFLRSPSRDLIFVRASRIFLPSRKELMTIPTLGSNSSLFTRRYWEILG